MSRAAVFLDRDGTINWEAGYIRELKNLNLMPGAAKAIKELNEMGVPVFLVTNQSGVARNYYPKSWIGKLHERLVLLLKEEAGATLDALYYCPHLPDGEVEEYSFACDCRKPEPGMLLQAKKDHDIDLERSIMVGDKATDIDVGKRVGAKTVLLTAGYGEQVLAGTYQHIPDPDFVADDLYKAHLNFIKPYFTNLKDS